jgi:hypothetical protein
VRSVLVHLSGCTEAEVHSLLAGAYPTQAGPPRIDLVDGDPCLYIDYYRDDAIELEPPDLERLLERFAGRMPLSVIANVSGRHDGAQQVRRFVETLLESWPGVAEDENSSHLWTLLEVRSGSGVDGRRFFLREGAS